VAILPILSYGAPVWIEGLQRKHNATKLRRVQRLINIKIARARGRTRNRWQDDVRECGRIVGGEEWQEKVYNREEWKKLLRMARNRCILHMSME
jgi:hypothetical protein